MDTAALQTIIESTAQFGVFGGLFIYSYINQNKREEKYIKLIESFTVSIDKNTKAIECLTKNE